MTEEPTREEWYDQEFHHYEVTITAYSLRGNEKAVRFQRDKYLALIHERDEERSAWGI